MDQIKKIFEPRILKGDLFLFDHNGKTVDDDRMLSPTSLLTIQVPKAAEKNDKSVVLDAIDFKQSTLQIDAIYFSRYMDLYLEFGRPKEMVNELLHKEPDVSIKEEKKPEPAKKERLIDRLNPFRKKKEKKTEMIKPDPEANLDKEFIERYASAGNNREKIDLCMERLEKLFQPMFDNKHAMAEEIHDRHRIEFMRYKDKFYDPAMDYEDVENRDNYLEQFKKLLFSPAVDSDLLTSIAATGHSIYVIEKGSHVLSLDENMGFATTGGYAVNATPFIGISSVKMVDLGLDVMFVPQHNIKDPKRIADTLNEEMAHKFAQMGNLDYIDEYLHSVNTEFSRNREKIVEIFDKLHGKENNKFRNPQYGVADIAPEIRVELYSVLKNGNETDKKEIRELMPETCKHVDAFIKQVSDFAKKARGETVDPPADLPDSKINLIGNSPPKGSNQSPGFRRGGV